MDLFEIMIFGLFLILGVGLVLAKTMAEIARLENAQRYLPPMAVPLRS